MYPDWPWSRLVTAGTGSEPERSSQDRHPWWPPRDCPACQIRLRCQPGTQSESVEVHGLTTPFQGNQHRSPRDSDTGSHPFAKNAKEWGTHNLISHLFRKPGPTAAADSTPANVDGYIGCIDWDWDRETDRRA